MTLSKQKFVERQAGSPTIYDLAQHLGISAGTVTRALNNQGRISPETRNQVLKTAKELGYRPSMVAQTLSHRKTRLLGVIVPMIGNTVYSPMVRAVEQVAREKEYNIILCDTDVRLDLERHYTDMLIRRRVEGVVVIPYAQRDRDGYNHLRELESRGIGVVVMEQDIPVETLTRIVPDNRGDARRMTEHLIGLGHRRIGYLSGGAPEWNISERERLEGYHAALTAGGIPADDSLVLEAYDRSIEDEEKAFCQEKVERYLARSDRPTAVFASTDMLAVKTMAVIRRMGLHIPNDIAVAGFDDILMSGYTVPPLTTVRQPAQQVGRRAAELLVERLSNEHSGDWPVHERISGELVIRESCGSKGLPGGKAR